MVESNANTNGARYGVGPHITEFYAENFKSLKVVRIVPKPGGGLVELTGPNASGKSAVLDGIYALFAGKSELDAVPIRRGQESALVRCTFGEIKIQRTWTEKGTVLTVESAAGAKYSSPQHVVETLFGKHTVEALAFDSLPAKKRLEVLRRLVPLSVNIDELETQNRADFDQRTEVNRALREVETQAMAIILPDGTPAEPIDTAQLLQAMEHASEVNAKIERAIVERGQLRDTIDVTRTRAQELRDQAQALLTRAELLEDEAVQQERALRTMAAVPDRLDVAKLRERVEMAQTTNAAVEKRARRSGLLTRALALRKESEDLTAAMAARTAARTAAIAAAKMPVPGLSFGDGDVLFNGLPYDQASQAQRIDISVGIQIAANPQVKVIRVKDASLLDPQYRRQIAERAAAAGYQTWFELVDPEARMGFHMVEGELAAIDGEPVVVEVATT